MACVHSEVLEHVDFAVLKCNIFSMIECGPSEEDSICGNKNENKNENKNAVCG